MVSAKKNVSKKVVSEVASKSAASSIGKSAIKKKLEKPSASDAKAVQKFGDGDKVIWLDGAFLASGSVVSAKASGVEVSMRNGGDVGVNGIANGTAKTVKRTLVRSDVLAYAKPNGTKEPESICLAPFAGQGFLTDAGHKYLMTHPQEYSASAPKEVAIGAKVILLGLPFGFESKDSVMTIGKIYSCLGCIGDRIITTTDIDGELSVYHHDLVELV